MRRDFVALGADQTLEKTLPEIEKHRRRPIYVVDGAETFMGRLSLNDGENRPDYARIGDLVEEDTWVCSPDDSLGSVFEKLVGREDLSLVPVVENEESPRLVGVVSASAVMLDYRKALRRSRMGDSEEQGP